MPLNLGQGLTLSAVVLCLGVSSCTMKEPIPPIPPIDPTLLPVVSSYSQRLRTHVEFLASPELKGRKPGTIGNQRAADYITQNFILAGLKPLPSLGSFRQSIGHLLGDNVLGVRFADTEKGRNRFIVVGAHFDHLGEIDGEIYPGADDNAAAVALLMELALATPSLKNYSVMFAAFNAEEPPYLGTSQMGSQYFVSYLPVEIGKLQNIQAAIIMDLMGGVHWEPLRNIVFTAGAEASQELYQHVKGELEIEGNGHHLVIKPIGLHLVEEIPVIGRKAFSDYDAFRNASVPIVFLSAGRTPRYHQPSDQPSTLYYERMALTTDWLQALLHRMDEQSKPYQLQPNRKEFADEVASFRPLITQAANWKTRIPGTSASSIEEFQSDVEWLNRLNPSQAGEEDIKRLERASIRLQCLLADFPLCGLF